MKLATIVIMSLTIHAMLWIDEAESRNAEKIDAHSLQDRTECRAEGERCLKDTDCCGSLICRTAFFAQDCAIDNSTNSFG